MKDIIDIIDNTEVVKESATSQLMFKLRIGDDGMCRGQHYPEDEWSEDIYAPSLHELAIKMLEHVTSFPKIVDLSMVKVLVFKDRIFELETVKPWIHENPELRYYSSATYKHFCDLFSNLPEREIKIAEDKKAKEIAEQKRLKEEKEKQDLKDQQEFERLKKRFQ